MKSFFAAQRIYTAQICSIRMFTVSPLNTCKLAEEMAFEIGHFRTFQTSVSLTLTLDRVIWHTFVYHSSVSNTNQISFESKNFFVDGRTDGLLRVAKNRKNCENHSDNLIIFSTRPYMELQQPVFATCLPVKSTAKACGHIRSPLMRDSRAGLTTTDER